MAELNYDFRDFFGSNNSPKTNQIIERISTPRPRRRSRAEDVTLPQLEEYKTSLSMDDIPKYQGAGDIPARDEAREAKGKAIATGVAALLGALSGGNVAQSALAGYQGMQRGQDRLWKSETDAYSRRQKQAMDLFNADTKAFGNKLGLERLLQSGVDARNRNANTQTDQRLRQAGLLDSAANADLRLDLDYQQMAQRGARSAPPMQDPKTNAAVAEYKRLNETLTNPTILKTLTNEQIGVFQSRRNELGKFLGFSGSLSTVTRAGLSDKEKADVGARLQSLGLRGQTLAFAKQRWAESEADRSSRRANIESLIEDRKKRGRLTDAQAVRIYNDYDNAQEMLDKAKQYEALSMAEKGVNGEEITPTMRDMYKRRAHDLWLRGQEIDARTRKLLGGMKFQSPASAKVLSTRPSVVRIPGTNKSAKITERK